MVAIIHNAILFRDAKLFFINKYLEAILIKQYHFMCKQGASLIRWHAHFYDSDPGFSYIWDNGFRFTITRFN